MARPEIHTNALVYELATAVLWNIAMSVVIRSFTGRAAGI